MRPVRPRAVRDLAGNMCKDHGSTLQRWHQHFHGVLNVLSSFDIQAVEAAEEYPVRSELADPQSEQEVMEAMGKLKTGWW